MSKRCRILIIDDSARDALLIERVLRKKWPALACKRIDSAATLGEALNEQSWDCVVCDMAMPGFSASAAMGIVGQLGFNLPFVIVSGIFDIESAIRLMKDGAHNFVRKDDPARLTPAVQRAIEDTRNLRIRTEAERCLHESEEKLRVITESALDAIVMLNKEARVSFWNRAAEQLFGYQSVEAMGKDLADLIIPKKYCAAHKQGCETFKKTGNGPLIGTTTEVDARRKDGSALAIEMVISKAELCGKPCAIGIMRNITARKQAQEELKKLSRAVESSASAVMITDRNGNVEYVNPKFCEVTGYTKAEVLGKTPRFLQSGETPKAVYVDLWETILSGGEWKGELHDKKKNGSLYWCHSSISPVKDAMEHITHFICIQEDVTREYELSEQLSFQASHDALTGLINRHEFERRVKRLLSTIRRDEDEHALCYLDLDQFKIVNDTCGHIAGDELLRQLSTVLRNMVRKRDTLARLGGDEFGVLMEHCSLSQAQRLATALQKAIQDYQFSWEEHSFKVGVSIGLVAITGAVPSLTELMKQADTACYMAKDAGRNQIHLYHVEDADLAQYQGEMQWVERIQQALKEQRFCLYAQPIMALDGGTDKQYELLIRMQDVAGEIIPPGAFLPAAERYNLITQVDCWVVEQAFSLMAAHPAFLKQVQHISINLSGQSLAAPGMLDFITAQLSSFGIGGEKICFEITETSAISNLGAAMTFISTLKEYGCRFALDDFGRGLSSFAYLKNLSVDYLKIDGMFVRDIVDDPVDHAMVKAINEIAQVMGIRTIAEFVENDAIKGMLTQVGVNYAQGYGIGKPQPFEGLLR